MTLRHSFPDRPIRFGTRGSTLALAQTKLAADRFRDSNPGRLLEIEVISTEGDFDKTSPLTEIGGRGVFTNALEAAILRGQVDAAVHSAKDLPSALHPAVPIVAFPNRDDPRDVLVSRHGTTLDQLPPNPVIGTSSRRREVQILRLRPDAQIVNIRGNIDTRLRKAAGSDFDAIVLAAAGLHRMAWEDRICEYFPVERVVPSPGQGAIAVQARAGSNAASVLAAIDDRAVSIPVTIERAFLAAIGAGCAYPVGAYAAASDPGYRLIAMLADPEGECIAWTNESLHVGEERSHAADIAARLRAKVGQPSAPSSWNGWIPEGKDLQGARIVVTRARQQSGPLTSALTKRGGTPVALPTIRIEPVADLALLDAAIDDAQRGAFDWFVFTSANAVEIVARRMDALNVHPEQLTALNVAAVGEATAAAVVRAGLNPTLVPEAATGDALAASLCRQMRPMARVLYPKSAIGREAVPIALRVAGCDLLSIDVYRTVPELDVDLAALDQVQRGEIDIITFASPSSVRNFIDLVGQECTAVRGIPVVCAGPVTAQAARDVGMTVVAVCDAPDAVAMTEAIATFWQRSVRRQAAAAMPATVVLERSAV